MARASDLHQHLIGLGLPVVGVSGNSAGNVRVDLAPGHTAQQASDANAAAQAFDWVPRRARSYASLISDIAGLSAADRNKLLAAVTADFIRRHPKFASTFSIAIDGDEPDV